MGQGRVWRSLIGGAAALCALPASAAPGDWPTFGGDPGGMRHSALTQITPANVARLEQAWVYHMKPADAPETMPAQPGPAERAQAAAEQMGPPGAPPRGPGPMFGAGGRFSASETTPLVVGGRMYLATPYGRVVALDPATGREIWARALPAGAQVATRGMEYWPGGKSAPAALIFGTRDGRLMSLRASDGTPSAGFGADGVVNMKTPDVMVTGTDKSYGMNSPPILWRNLVITGSNTGEGTGGPIGDVRAWDAATGRHVWTFRSVPQPGERFGDSWAGDSGKNRSGVNVWGMMTVDAARGIVYMPFGAPANDRVGVDRAGDNLFGSSIVAADARTGKYLWHFQIVHHDIWDNDAQAPPALFDVKRGGRTVPAVGIISKNGLFFVLNRVTGEPIHGVEERAVPKSEVPGEITSPTQPFPTVTPPLTRMTMTADAVSKVTPQHEAFCRALIADNKLVLGGPYLPATWQRPMVYFPGTINALFGGAMDPKTGLYVVNVHALAQIQEIRPNGRGGFANNGPLNGRFWDPKTRMLCQDDAWGELIAVDVHTGAIAWHSRLGVTDALPADRQLTGRPSTGGPITTAGGLTFIAATDDKRFRAFDTRTGKEVWTVTLPASGHADPISYAAGGRQYVGIVATGGSFIGTPVESDSLVMWALKK